jgi:integrase
MLYKSANSPYWRYDFVIAGMRYSKSTRTADKAQARRIEAEARRQALDPDKKRPTITLDEAAGLYATRVETLPAWPTTRIMLRAMLATIGKDRLLSDITQRELMDAVAKRRFGRQPSSVNREIETWRACWRYAAKARYDVGEMPDWHGLMLPTPKLTPKSYTREQEAALFANLRADLHDFVAFALASGWRASEVINLRWADIDLAARMARTRIKGADVIERPLSRDMLALIASQPRICPQVFTYVAQKTRAAHKAKDGRKRAARMTGERYPLSKAGWSKPWRAALKAAGIEGLCFHTLRHTRAKRMTAARVPLPAIAQALGHRSIKTTMRYASASADDVRAGLDASENNLPDAHFVVATGHKLA